MKIFLFILLASPLSLLTSACGFTPMYGNALGGDYGAEELLSHIRIERIPDREGVFLRNVLIDRFHRKGAPADPAYSLSVTDLESRTIDLDLTEEADTTREQMRFSAEIILRDLVTGEVVLKQKVLSLASYNVLGSEFATRVSRQNARENALSDLARQIETRLSLYFNRTAGGL